MKNYCWGKTQEGALTLSKEELKEDILKQILLRVINEEKKNVRLKPTDRISDTQMVEKLAKIVRSCVDAD